MERKSKIGYVILSIIMILLGLCMILRPVDSAEIICVATGAGLLLVSILVVIRFFASPDRPLSMQVLLAIAVVVGVFGIILLFRPAWIIALIHIILGSVIAVDGIFKLIKALEAKAYGMQYWWLVLIFAIATCVFGTLLIFNPFKGASILMTFIGVVLIVEGIQNIWVGVYTVRR